MISSQSGHLSVHVIHPDRTIHTDPFLQSWHYLCIQMRTIHHDILKTTYGVFIPSSKENDQFFSTVCSETRDYVLTHNRIR